MLKLEEVITPNWDSVISDTKVLVLFWAPWCEACKAQENIIASMNADSINDYKLVKLNIDDNRWLSKKLGVRNIPTVIMYNSGIEEIRFSELVSTDVLRNKINK
ncbi:MAG: thioredoxin family protein [Bacteroidales bacterium]|nr:thioredoxin family protein [Bacteroidales bacterium]